VRFAERLSIALIFALSVAGCATPVTAPSSSPTAARATPRPVAPPPEAPVSSDLQRSYDQALAHLKAGRHKEAEQALLALTRRAPELSGPYANLGLLYQRAGRNSEAIAALERAIAVNPRRAMYYNELGIVYRHEGKFDMALRNYHKALDRDQGYAPAHLNIAILYDLYLQEPQKALPHYQRYRDLVPAEAATVSKWIIDLERRGRSPKKPGGNG
jgi:tetratricopeptide (TPR) repeat protein